MHPVESYLNMLWAIRNPDAAVPETSGYSLLTALLDAASARLLSRVRSIIGLSAGGGPPDAGFFITGALRHEDGRKQAGVNLTV